jgi:hypothetical protein
VTIVSPRRRLSVEDVIAARQGDGVSVRLQLYLAALRDLLADAREELDEREWSTFIDIACNAVGTDAAKVVVAELQERAA